MVGCGFVLVAFTSSSPVSQHSPELQKHMTDIWATSHIAGRSSHKIGGTENMHLFFFSEEACHAEFISASVLIQDVDGWDEGFLAGRKPFRPRSAFTTPITNATIGGPLR